MPPYRATIWPEVQNPPSPTAAVFCIRSVVKPPEDPTKYATQDTYNNAVKLHFGQTLPSEWAARPHEIFANVKRQLLSTQGGVLLVIEATERIPTMATCIRAFDDVRHELTQRLERHAPRIIPVVIRDPLISHGNGGNGYDGRAELATAIEQRRIRTVDTNVAETAKQFKDFLARLWP